MFGPTLFRSAGPGSSIESWTLPALAGSYALKADGSGALLALSDGIYNLTFADNSIELWHPAPFDPQFFHFSDGRCDPSGRFWVGSNRHPGSGQLRGSASYYRLDGHGLQRQFGGVTIANGLAFSPDGRTMYTADVTRSCIFAHRYDTDSGNAYDARVFAHVEPGDFPDGAAVDVDGGYWIALYGRGVIVRFRPDGSRDKVLRAPVTHPTMVCIGGEEGTTMFVTSARRFMSEEALESEPLAGGVFAADIGVRGIIEPRFAFPQR